MKLFDKLLDYFITTNNMWAILFVFSFIFMIITNGRREEERRQELKEFREKLEADIEQLKQTSNVILETWKVLIQRELKRRK